MSFRKIKSALLTSALICILAMPASAKMVDYDIVTLRSLDKVSARSTTFEIPVGKTVKFGGSLFIKVQACRKSAPIDDPESASFLQIWEKKPDAEKASWIFSGWMFASSPALSAMDHPVYDVWVLDCKEAMTSDKAEEAFVAEDAPEENAASSSE